MTAAITATDPPIALTHVPLSRIPRGAVHALGHLHGMGAGAWRRRDVGVDVIDLAQPAPRSAPRGPRGRGADRNPRDPARAQRGSRRGCGTVACAGVESRIRRWPRRWCASAQARLSLGHGGARVRAGRFSSPEHTGDWEAGEVVGVARAGTRRASTAARTSRTAGQPQQFQTERNRLVRGHDDADRHGLVGRGNLEPGPGRGGRPRSRKTTRRL